ncbi:hypothetical protein [Microlunatus ginsengisoli]|uniref:Uncharacterized protein n=1 Tax=Microlunatus ginsengisoli TaxID=363863 RepID=A0ABP7AYL0_9ACTN
MSRTNRIGVTLAAVATLGLLAGATGCSANLSDSVLPVDQQSSPAKQQPVGSTLGYNVLNESGQRLVFQKVTGKLPAPPTSQSTVYPFDKVNFQLHYPGPGGHSSGDAWYSVVNAEGTTTGSIDFHFDAGTLGKSTITQYDTNNNVINPSSWTVNTTFDPGTFQDVTVTDMKGSGDTDVDITPGQNGWTQDEVSSILKQQCLSKNCSYDDVTTTDTRADPVVLASAYNANPAGGDSSSVSTEQGYEQSTTNSWDTTYSSEVQLMDAVTVGVTTSVGYSVTTSQNFGTSYSINIPGDSTGVIWGEAPLIHSSGDFTVTAGNTSLHFKGSTFDYPDPHGAMVYKSASNYTGDQTNDFPAAPGVNNNTVTVAAPEHPKTVK